MSWCREEEEEETDEETAEEDAEAEETEAWSADAEEECRRSGRRRRVLHGCMSVPHCWW